MNPHRHIPRPRTRRRPVPCTPARIAAVARLVTEAEDRCDNPDHLLTDLYRMLGRLDPATAPQHPALMRAAGIYLSLGKLDPDREHAWLDYAHQCSRCLLDPDDRDAVSIAELWVEHLAEHDAPRHAAQVQHQIVAYHRRAADIRAVLRARAELVGLLHAAGRCADAKTEITQVWNLWRQDWASDTHLGRDTVHTYLAILHGCDRAGDARAVLASARRLITDPLNGSCGPGCPCETTQTAFCTVPTPTGARS